MVIEIYASKVEIDLDGYKEEMFDEELDVWDRDELYDGFIHEVVTRPSYTWDVVD